MNPVSGGADDPPQVFATAYLASQSVLGSEVPARKQQRDSEHQPSCRVEQHIAPDAMGDGKHRVDEKPAGQRNRYGVPGVQPAFHERTPGQQQSRIRVTTSPLKDEYRFRMSRHRGAVNEATKIGRAHV